MTLVKHANETWLTFYPDWRAEQSGPLFAGHKLRVQYALERLHSKADGADDAATSKTWTITGFARLGGAVETFAVAGQSIAGGMPINPFIELEVAGELEMWFELSDIYGKVQYDSDFGRNYRFTVHPSLEITDAWMAEHGDAEDLAQWSALPQ